MKRISHEMKWALGLALVVSVAVMTAACGEKSTGQSAMVIVHTSGSASVVKGDQTQAAKVGMLVGANDTIKTEQGMVDLQTKSGSAIRVKDWTTMKVASLYGGNNKETQLSMQHGSMMANVDKRASDEDFKVTTPTAIAGVRGTTFTVESNEGEPTRVKVINGKVAMKPRFTALEKVSADDIKSNENLQKLQQLQDQAEVVVEDSSAGELNAKVEQVVRKMNTETDQAAEKQAVIAVVEKSFDAVEKTTAAEEAQAVTVVKEEVTADEKIEKENLVTVDEDLVEEIQAGKANTEVIAKITEERQQKQEQVLERIEEDASKTTLKDEAEIQKHYNKLEVLNMKNGTQVRGAVIAQTGSVMVVHTPEGVKRIQTSEVDSISFP
ncbi:MAG: FecR domain-containing protein [Leptospiraceae bacterium]|nr:FecR domain-containing protein [Leptospiraceae bacterium]